MATYLQNGKDSFSQQPLFTPNFGLIQQVLQNKQAQYDRGFAAVRSLHNSLLNSQVTNAENQEFKDRAFESIQDNIAKLANTDLSKISAVQEAVKVFDPLVNDQELIHDIAVTKRLQRAQRTAQTHKNSIDPEVRKLYSQEAEQYIQYKSEALANASRGDGSILNQQGADFVPFEDWAGDLFEAAKEEGLEIVLSENDESGLRLVSTTNNPKYVVPTFTSWASMHMGTKYDRQFAVQGEVQVENKIRSLMSGGLTRDEATLQVASESAPQLIEEHARAAEVVDADINAVNDRLQHLRAAHGENLSGKELLRYNGLQDEKKALLKAKESLEGNSRVIMTSDLQNIAANLGQLNAAKIKFTASEDWAKTYSASTYKVDIKADRAALQIADHKFKLTLEDARQQFQWAKMNAQNKYDWGKMLAEQDFELNKIQDQHKFDIAIAYMKLHGKMLKDANGDFDFEAMSSGVEDAGVSDTEPITPHEVMLNDLQNTTDGVIASTFAPDGVMKYLYPKTGDNKAKNTEIQNSMNTVGLYLDQVSKGATPENEEEFENAIEILAEEFGFEHTKGVNYKNKRSAAALAGVIGNAMISKFDNYIQNVKSESSSEPLSKEYFIQAERAKQELLAHSDEFDKVQNDEQDYMYSFLVNESEDADGNVTYSIREDSDFDLNKKYEFVPLDDTGLDIKAPEEYGHNEQAASYMSTTAAAAYNKTNPATPTPYYTIEHPSAKHGSKRYATDSKGRPLIRVRNVPGNNGLSPQEIEMLGGVAPDVYQNRTGFAGKNLIVKGASSSDYQQFFSRNSGVTNVTIINSNGEEEDISADFINGKEGLNIQNMSGNSISELFGNEYGAEIDPVADEVTLTFKMDIGSTEFSRLSSKGTSLKNAKTIKITIPQSKYAAIENNNSTIQSKLRESNEKTSLSSGYGRRLLSGGNNVSLDGHFDLAFKDATVQIQKLKSGQYQMLLNGYQSVWNEKLGEEEWVQFEEALPMAGSRPTPKEISILENTVSAAASSIIGYNNYKALLEREKEVVTEDVQK